MDPLTFGLLAVIILLVICCLFLVKPNGLEKLGVLHRRSLPLLGDALPILLRRVHMVDVIERNYRISEDALYVGFHDFTVPTILVRSPELMKSISVRSFDHFADHRAIVDHEQEPLFGKNLLGLRGAKWREMRNLLTPAFTGSKMKSMFALMSECARSFTDCLAERSTAESSGNKPLILDTKEAFTRYTNDVIASCAFGISVDSMRNPRNEFYVLGREANAMSGWRMLKFFLLRSFPSLARLLNLRFIDPKAEAFFENVVRETIATRDREGIVRPDMIQLMMETRGTSRKLTIQEMTAQAFTFFLGGFDTTAVLMCFVAYELATNEDVQAKLRREVDEVLASVEGEKSVSYEAINGCRYLDAVVNETLRLYPPNPFLDRVCVKTYELPAALPGGKSVVVEPGQNFWFPTYSVHRDEKYFPDPMRFDPERFVAGDGKTRVDVSAFLPFGQGPRMCIGNRFALLETKVMIFYLLSKCHLKRSPRTRVPLELSPSSIFLVPKGGFWIQLEARKKID